MSWEELKRRIYHEDGSLRDIYIRNITPDDWKRWVDYVNSSYVVDFEVGNTVRRNKIDFEVVVAYWKGQEHQCPSASIHIGNIIVKTYFFVENEIENDIAPKEITTLQDHERIIEYLKNISKLLGRPVELTEENYQDPKELLMVVHEEQVIFPSK